jgi:hypothetical protein
VLSKLFPSLMRPAQYPWGTDTPSRRLTRSGTQPRQGSRSFRHRSDQSLAKVKQGKQLLEEDQAREGGELLLLETQLWQTASSFVRFSGRRKTQKTLVAGLHQW